MDRSPKRQPIFEAPDGHQYTLFVDQETGKKSLLQVLSWEEIELARQILEPIILRPGDEPIGPIEPRVEEGVVIKKIPPESYEKLLRKVAATRRSRHREQGETESEIEL